MNYISDYHKNRSRLISYLLFSSRWNCNRVFPKKEISISAYLQQEYLQEGLNNIQISQKAWEIDNWI